jgi:hypothetical protein
MTQQQIHMQRDRARAVTILHRARAAIPSTQLTPRLAGIPSWLNH